jgi:serine/threonine-protein kinase
VLVICQTQPGTFYYSGVRLSDGASIELANAVRSSAGFDVTNPTDGTRYQIRPTSLTIAPPDAPVSTEPMLEYASS